MSTHLLLVVTHAPNAALVGQRHAMEPGTWRVLGRASPGADTTLSLTQEGDRTLDEDRQSLVDRAVGGTDRVRENHSRRAPDLELPDDGVSRTHAMVFVDATGNASLVDLMSTNGTRLNGHDVQDADVLVGDEIGLGATLLRLEAQSGGPKTRA